MNKSMKIENKWINQWNCTFIGLGEHDLQRLNALPKHNYSSKQVSRMYYL